MKKKIRNDENMPVGRLIPIRDFLPPPDKLFSKEEKTKITITLDSATVQFFKKAARRAGLKYQRVIREVLKGYAARYA